MNLWKTIVSYFDRKRNERITLMIIPHDDAKILNVQLSKLSIVFTFFVIFLVVFASYIAWLRQYSMKTQVQELHSADKEVLEKQSMFLSRYYDLQNVHKDFENNLLQFVQSHDLMSLKAVVAQDKNFSIASAEEQLEEESLSLVSQNKEKAAKEVTNVLLPIQNREIKAKTVNQNFRYSKEVIVYRSLVISLKQTNQMLQGLNTLFDVRTKAQRNIPVRWPTSGGHFTSFFGPRYHPISKVQREFHFGVDIANVTGTPIYAAADGRVHSANFSSGGYGNRIRITHKFGYSSVYAHLHSIVVRNGQYVKRGQLIGRMGSTGRSTGPHLHFEVRLDGKPINPLPFISNI